MSLKNATIHFDEAPFTSFDVARVDLQGALGELFELQIELHDRDASVDFFAVVGKAVRVELRDEPFAPTVQGIVRRVRQPTAVPTGVSAYELTVVPPHWLLTRKRDNRIFRDASVPEIVAKVLEGYGGRIPAFANKLTRPAAAAKPTFPKRDYTTQYAETDHDFVMRLLAEEGITSFFDHGNGSAWTLVDDTPSAAVAVTTDEVPFRAKANHISTPHVSSVMISSDIETSAVRVRDWDYMKPARPLQADSGKPEGALFANENDLEDHVYEVGEFKDEAGGKKRAGRLLEEARAMHRVVTITPSFLAHPGQKLTLSFHPRDDVNTDYVVVRSSYTNVEGAKVYSLDCIARTTQYRPAQRPKPRIHGTQTARVVTDNEQEEIAVDALGRVKLLFHWDERDVTSGDVTRFVRVSQAWAGAGFGFTMLPRRGDEVVVAYLDGDPDEPIVVGRVHNATHMPPIDLPKHKTQSSWKSRSTPGGPGFNEIMMEDQRGAELLRMRAERNFEHLTNVDSSTTVGHDQSIHVGAAQTTTAGSIAASSGSFVHVDAKTNIAETAGDRISMDAGHTLHARAGSSVVDLDNEAGSIAIKSTTITASMSETIVSDAKTTLVNKAGTLVSIYAGATARLYGRGYVVVESDDHADVTAGVAANVTAPTIEVKGDSVKIRGAAKLVLEGGNIQIVGGTVHVSGSDVSVKGDNAVKIDGAIIKLNC